MNNNDTNSVKSALSAFADGEHDEKDTIALNVMVERACHDKDLTATWQSAHLVRDVLQADYHPAIPVDFTARVSAAIAREADFDEYAADIESGPSVVSLTDARDRIASRRNTSRREADRTSRRPSALWRPVAGLGLAASVAGAALLFTQLQQPDAKDGVQVADAGVVASEQAIQTAASTQQNLVDSDAQVLQASVRIGDNGTRWRTDNDVTRNEAIEQRLNMLLTNHLEDASMGRVNGMISHSRVVGYDTTGFQSSATESGGQSE